MMNVYAILMAGGIGTRFWPRSRKGMPKQVLNIAGENTMVRDTVDRLDGIVDESGIFVVTTYEQQRIIQEQLPMLGPENFILEPFGRNTAPCIGLAAIHLIIQDPDALMVVMPADHIITNVREFQSLLRLAIDFAAENDCLVTLGITPNEPATGYGYIQSGEKILTREHTTIYKVRTFAEKPNLATAKRFLESGDFYWNSGMFIWKASVILHEISDKLPEIYERLLEIKESIHSPDYLVKLEETYRQIRSISIDFGVMQDADNVYVIPADIGWNDVGSWETVYDISAKDKNANSGEYLELISVDAKKCYVHSPEKVVALVGVDNLIVVDTGDALLVCKRTDAQKVKEAVEYLNKKGMEKWL